MLSFHNAAVKDVKWSQEGFFVLSCGYDASSRLVDVEKGIETQVFKEDQVVSVVKFHPDNLNLFMAGGSRGGLKLWDIRNGKVVHQYIRGHDPILDVEFTTNGKQIISSSDVSGRNLSENSIVVWDVSRQVPLSNQVSDFFYSSLNIFYKMLCFTYLSKFHDLDHIFQMWLSRFPGFIYSSELVCTAILHCPVRICIHPFWENILLLTPLHFNMLCHLVFSTFCVAWSCHSF